jgi:Flp pilus assembly protein protease CpaA
VAKKVERGFAGCHGIQWPIIMNDRIFTKAIHVPAPARTGEGTVFLLHGFRQRWDSRMNLWSLILLVPVALALFYDLRTREIPDWIPLLILAWACLATAIGLLHKVSWPWLDLIAGSLLGLGLGAAVFYLGWLGGGDVKLVSAIGAAVGPWTLFSVLAWMAFAGGVLALVSAARGKQDFAYVPAIAVGVIAETFWPGGLARVLLR